MLEGERLAYVVTMSMDASVSDVSHTSIILWIGPHLES